MSESWLDRVREPKRPKCLLLLLLWVALLQSCSSDETGGRADAGDSGAPDAVADSGGEDAGDADAADAADGLDEDAIGPLGEGSLRYDLAASLADDFFAFPYPSDARTTSRGGTPDLSSFPTAPATLDLLTPSIALIEAGSPGFSPLSAVYFTFGESLDPSTLPATVEDALAGDASVFLLDVTPGSPTYGQRQPCTVAYREEVGIYWPARTLVLHPLYAIPLRTATTYAAVVTRAVHAAGGAELDPPDAVARLDELLARDDAPPEVLALRPLQDVLDDTDLDLGIQTADLLAATVFTTSDPMAELRALADWLRETGDAPSTSGWVLADSDTGTGFEVYEAQLQAWELFSGEVPYRGFGDGLIARDVDGAPATPTRVTLRLAVSVPSGSMPEGGWPMLLYSHGLGEDYRGFVDVAAAEMAARGVAVMGLDPPLQGGRNPTSQSDRDLIVGLSVSNIVVGREILRQGALDAVQLERLVADGMTIPAGVASGGADIGFDQDRVAFMGHSEGAQVGALFLPFSQLAHSGVLSEGGGGGALTMLSLQLPEIDVAAVVARALGISESVEAFDLDHPVTSVVIQPLLDPADPLHTARQLFSEPLQGGPRNLLMLEGFQDPLTPPPVIEAMASAARLPIAEPVSRDIAGLQLQGVDSVALPAHDNVEDGEGHSATAALLQFPDDGHYIIYFNESGRTQIFDFLAAALDGDATIPAPEP